MNVGKEDRNVKTKMKNSGTHIDKGILFGSSALVLPFIILGAIAPELLTRGGSTVLSWVTNTWGWLYLSSVNVFVVFGLLLAFSPFGSVRLGKDNEKPEFRRLSWFAMLFSAGMGIGLVFWSIAEPLYHFSGPPIGEPKTAESARLAFSIFFHHWGLHAWGTYVAVGLPMAYFQFRKGMPGSVSSCLLPLFRKNSIDGGGAPSPCAHYFGKFVDILAVWATVLGVVTSLGLGALQISSGLSITFDIPDNSFTTGTVIVVITLLFVLSALSGIQRGIKLLSLTNIAIMILLFCFFLVFGPFTYITHTFFTALGDYLTGVIPLSTTLTLFDNKEWTGSWTIFYWAWWIAWAPFVGTFIANISRGRTIREFILVVMIVPALFSYLFSAALGGTAIHMQLFENIPLLDIIAESIEATLFETLRHLPFYAFTAIVANILIASFFITSADSATFVICRFSQGQNSTQESNVSQPLIIFWGVTLGGLALVLVFSGGLKALQTASIIGALPFVFVIYMLCFSLIRELIAEKYGLN